MVRLIDVRYAPIAPKFRSATKRRDVPAAVIVESEPTVAEESVADVA